MFSQVDRKESACSCVPYCFGLLTQANQALKERSRMVVDRQLFCYELGPVEGKEVSKIGIVAE